jgi:D-alanine-D-alanine ligase
MKHVVVLMGGLSAEREISLASGRAVAAGLVEAGYRVTALDVDRIDWVMPPEVDVVFIALHGTYGEDGQVQARLDAEGVRYAGADAGVSRIAFDKVLSKQCFEQQGITTPRYEVVRAGSVRSLPLPVVVKPPRQGSSIGIARVFEESAWSDAMKGALRHDDEVLVEAYIEGRELTVGVVNDQVLPIVEIRAPSGDYNYHNKYTKGTTEYLCPAPLDEATTRRCQELAWQTFTALGARDLGRVDIRLTGDGVPYVLELNTIPGFTETSLLPKAARAAGLEFPALCAMIVERARQRA